MTDLATATGRALCRLANDLEVTALVPGGCTDRFNLEALGVAFWTLLVSLTLFTLADWLWSRTDLRSRLAGGWRRLLSFSFDPEHPVGQVPRSPGAGGAPSSRAPSSRASEAGRGGARESLHT